MSDASSVPRSPEGIARELRELLAAQGINPPYVLVGHQAGGLYVREFQALYPNAVAGLVLVDPSDEGEDELWRSLDADSHAEYLARKRSFFSTISDVAAREFDAYTDLLQADHPSSIEPLADVPVVVLSGLRPFESPRWVGETQEGLKAKEALHRSLADALGGDFVASAKTSTYIHLEDPQLVVDAVNRSLDAIEE
jgi:pimeloyl-ACP methyl ester carboxylesterase